jgi:hypothetical protein
MDKSRFLEEDFNDFLKELLDGQMLGDSAAEGITKLVIDKGYDSLSDKQRYVFDKAIGEHFTDECSRCGLDIPWTEMTATEFNGGMCGWCQQLSRHDD